MLQQKCLLGLRFVVTLPPAEWFGGVDLARARDQVIALRKLGAEVHEFDTTSVYATGQPRLHSLIDQIRAFGPDAVIGTPHAGYAVQGGMIATGPRSRTGR